MKRTICLSLPFLLAACIAGCVFDSDGSEPTGKGSYAIETRRAVIDSYPGGGGMFVFSMTVGDDFEGTVQLLLKADRALNAHLSTDMLTRGSSVAEVEIRPAETAATCEYAILVVSHNEDTADTLTLKATLAEPDSTVRHNTGSGQPPDEFVGLLEDTGLGLGITTDMEWFAYANSPTAQNGGGRHTYLNGTWEVTIVSALLPEAPTWYLLRKRGDMEPMIVAREDLYESLHEIPLSEYPVWLHYFY